MLSYFLNRRQENPEVSPSIQELVEGILLDKVKFTRFQPSNILQILFGVECYFCSGRVRTHHNGVRLESYYSRDRSVLDDFSGSPKIYTAHESCANVACRGEFSVSIS